MAKKSIKITLYMSEMIYDVQNKTYLKGRSKTEIDATRKAYMQANDDDENLNQVLRSIGGAYGSLKAELSENIVEQASSGNNIQMDQENIVVMMSMPSNFNEAAVEVISTGMHKYIVNTAIAEWFDLTSPDDSKNYANLAVENMREVHEGFNKRVRPERPEVEPEDEGQ